MSMWHNTTHDWASTLDREHFSAIRSRPGLYAPGGVLHLVLEAIAYPVDEALHVGAGNCAVILHSDGSVSVSDDGRGTDTRRDSDGAPVKKPVMATKDLRFFDSPGAPTLPDGHPRRGMSVVAALSTWLMHTNNRHNGAWTERYEHAIPVTDLVPIAGDGSTGTTVHFMPDRALLGPALLTAAELGRCAWPPPITVGITDLTAT